MAEQFKCSTCGVVSSDKQHLCQPVQQGEGAHCGSTPTQSTNMCDDINQKGEYACSSCGRTTVDPDLVCKPVKR